MVIQLEAHKPDFKPEVLIEFETRRARSMPIHMRPRKPLEEDKLSRRTTQTLLKVVHKSADIKGGNAAQLHRHNYLHQR